MEDPEAIAINQLRRAAGSLLEDVGFTHAQESSLNMLTDVMKRFMETVCKETKIACDSAGRLDPVLEDIKLALDVMHFDTVDFHTYLRQVGPIPGPPPLPRYPVASTRCNYIHGYRASEQEIKSRPEHITEWTPAVRPDARQIYEEAASSRPGPSTATFTKERQPIRTFEDKRDAILARCDAELPNFLGQCAPQLGMTKKERVDSPPVLQPMFKKEKDEPKPSTSAAPPSLPSTSSGPSTSSSPAKKPKTKVNSISRPPSVALSTPLNSTTPLSAKPTTVKQKKQKSEEKNSRHTPISREEACVSRMSKCSDGNSRDSPMPRLERNEVFDGGHQVNAACINCIVEPASEKDIEIPHTPGANSPVESDPLFFDPDPFGRLQMNSASSNKHKKGTPSKDKEEERRRKEERKAKKAAKKAAAEEAARLAAETARIEAAKEAERKEAERKERERLEAERIAREEEERQRKELMDRLVAEAMAKKKLDKMRERAAQISQLIGMEKDTQEEKKKKRKEEKEKEREEKEKERERKKEKERMKDEERKRNEERRKAEKEAERRREEEERRKKAELERAQEQEMERERELERERERESERIRRDDAPPTPSMPMLKSPTSAILEDDNEDSSATIPFMEGDPTSTTSITPPPTIFPLNMSIHDPPQWNQTMEPKRTVTPIKIKPKDEDHEHRHKKKRKKEKGREREKLGTPTEDERRLEKERRRQKKKEKKRREEERERKECEEREKEKESPSKSALKLTIKLGGGGSATPSTEEKNPIRLKIKPTEEKKREKKKKKRKDHNGATTSQATDSSSSDSSSAESDDERAKWRPTPKPPPQPEPKIEPPKQESSSIKVEKKPDKKVDAKKEKKKELKPDAFTLALEKAARMKEREKENKKRKEKKREEEPQKDAVPIEDDDIWICPVCSVAYVDGAEMVCCDSCDEWFHWACVGLRVEPPSDCPWFCARCKAKRERDERKRLGENDLASSLPYKKSRK